MSYLLLLSNEEKRSKIQNSTSGSEVLNEFLSLHILPGLPGFSGV
jgi:hypothetical protein